MRPLASGELVRLQQHRVSAMQDTCVILRYVRPNTYAPDASATPCSFRDPGQVGDAALFLSAATSPGAAVALPRTAVLDPRDRVRITHRLGQVLTTPEDYQQEGEQQHGPLTLVIDLRKVQK